MADGLDEAAAEMISAINQSMQSTGMRRLLEVPDIREMHGRLTGLSFYRPAIKILEGLIETANRNGLTPIAKEHAARLAFASSMLERALLETSTQAAYDAEPQMWYDPEAGQQHIIVGGGHQEGGYII